MRQACEDTSISLQLAEALRGKDALPVDELMRVWDPNKDGSISKLEFRVNVRKRWAKEAMAPLPAPFAVLFHMHTPFSSSSLELATCDTSLPGAVAGTQAGRQGWV